MTNNSRTNRFSLDIGIPLEDPLHHSFSFGHEIVKNLIEDRILSLINSVPRSLLPRSAVTYHARQVYNEACDNGVFFVACEEDDDGVSTWVEVSSEAAITYLANMVHDNLFTTTAMEIQVSSSDTTQTFGDDGFSER